MATRTVSQEVFLQNPSSDGGINVQDSPKEFSKKLSTKLENITLERGSSEANMTITSNGPPRRQSDGAVSSYLVGRRFSLSRDSSLSRLPENPEPKTFDRGRASSVEPRRSSIKIGGLGCPPAGFRPGRRYSIQTETPTRQISQVSGAGLPGRSRRPAPAGGGGVSGVSSIRSMPSSPVSSRRIQSTMGDTSQTAMVPLSTTRSVSGRMFPPVTNTHPQPYYSTQSHHNPLGGMIQVPQTSPSAINISATGNVHISINTDQPLAMIGRSTGGQATDFALWTLGQNGIQKPPFLTQGYQSFPDQHNASVIQQDVSCLQQNMLGAQPGLTFMKGNPVTLNNQVILNGACPVNVNQNNIQNYPTKGYTPELHAMSNLSSVEPKGRQQMPSVVGSDQHQYNDGQTTNWGSFVLESAASDQHQLLQANSVVAGIPHIRKTSDKEIPKEMQQKKESVSNQPEQCTGTAISMDSNCKYAEDKSGMKGQIQRRKSVQDLIQGFEGVLKLCPSEDDIDLEPEDRGGDLEEDTNETSVAKEANVSESEGKGTQDVLEKKTICTGDDKTLSCPLQNNFNSQVSTPEGSSQTQTEGISSAKAKKVSTTIGCVQTEANDDDVKENNDAAQEWILADKGTGTSDVCKLRPVISEFSLQEIQYDVSDVTLVTDEQEGNISN